MHDRRPAGRGRRSNKPAGRVSVRRAAVRVDRQAADWVRLGHPWVFRAAVRADTAPKGLVDVLDPRGDVVGRGYFVRSGPIAVRVLTRDPRIDRPAALARRVVGRALDLRRDLLAPDLTAYRVIHGDGEGLSGLVVERFGRFAVLQQFCEEAEFLVEPVCEAVGSALGLSGLYLQERFRPPEPGKPRQAARLVWGHKADVEELVTEGGLRFSVDVRAPQSVGLFLDFRLVRSYLNRIAAGRRVLNCFSHTGALSVVAAAAGAAEVVSVDVSSRYQAWAQKNFRLNGLDPAAYQFEAADAISALHRWGKKKGPLFDVVILDPPTFSAGRGKPFSVAKDYPELVEASVNVLSPGGYLLAASNTVKMSDVEFWRLLAEGAKRARRDLVLVHRFSLPPDFPIPPVFAEGQYHKAVVARVL
ncbi:MAG: class I SAM-dependent rRNA methyltransferase [Deltaproteobacteria bacterium]|nr:class I SAM-dependent rRNA methyltransferase [Deltaproteobacteria bacterium]